MKSNLSILLVDDSYIDRLVTSMVIKNGTGITTVHEASGGKKALEFLRTVRDTSQRLLILLDIKMPEMSGFEFLNEFEKLDDSFKKNIDILMLSSTLDPDDILHAENNPRVIKLLSKPLSVNELMQLIDQLI